MKNLKNLCMKTNNNIHKLPNKSINLSEKKNNLENTLSVSFYNSLNKMKILNLDESNSIKESNITKEFNQFNNTKESNEYNTIKESNTNKQNLKHKFCNIEVQTDISCMTLPQFSNSSELKFNNQEYNKDDKMRDIVIINDNKINNCNDNKIKNSNDNKIYNYQRYKNKITELDILAAENIVFLNNQINERKFIKPKDVKNNKKCRKSNRIRGKPLTYSDEYEKYNKSPHGKLYNFTYNDFIKDFNESKIIKKKNYIKINIKNPQIKIKNNIKKKPIRGGINKFHKFSHSLKGKGYSMKEIGKMYREKIEKKK